VYTNTELSNADDAIKLAQSFLSLYTFYSSWFTELRCISHCSGKIPTWQRYRTFYL